MDGCVSPFIGEGSFASKLCGGMGARHGACHACPLGHFMNSARGQVTLYMTCRGTVVLSAVWPSRRGLVDAGSDCSRQPASRRSRSAGSRPGSRPGGAVGRGAGRSGRAVGLRGFASPDVLKYCLAVFGIPVSNYSDSSPQASGQLGKVGRRFFRECSWK